MTRETLFMKAINEGLDQAMERDERVVLLGEDIAGGVNVEHLENNNEDARLFISFSGDGAYGTKTCTRVDV